MRRWQWWLTDRGPNDIGATIDAATAEEAAEIAAAQFQIHEQAFCDEPYVLSGETIAFSVKPESGGPEQSVWVEYSPEPRVVRNALGVVA